MNGRQTGQRSFQRCWVTHDYVGAAVVVLGVLFVLLVLFVLFTGCHLVQDGISDCCCQRLVNVHRDGKRTAQLRRQHVPHRGVVGGSFGADAVH